MIDYPSQRRLQDKSLSNSNGICAKKKSVGRQEGFSKKREASTAHVGEQVFSVLYNYFGGVQD